MFFFNFFFLHSIVLTCVGFLSTLAAESVKVNFNKAKLCFVHLCDMHVCILSTFLNRSSSSCMLFLLNCRTHYLYPCLEKKQNNRKCNNDVDVYYCVQHTYVLSNLNYVAHINVSIVRLSHAQIYT